jgi:hypothetical protein
LRIAPHDVGLLAGGILMKRLILLILIAAAAWYGWKMYPNLANRRPGHEAVIVNESGQPLERLSLHIGSQVFGKEKLADGEKWILPFKVNSDSNFSLEWQIANQIGIHSWSGGMVTAGPMLQRHMMKIEEDNSVNYNAESKGLPAP